MLPTSWPRYGGDEFLYLLPETGVEGAATVAERIRVRIAETPLATAPVSSSVSIGVAAYGQHGSDFDVLARSADRALYAAKAQGRNRVAVFRPDMLAS